MNKTNKYGLLGFAAFALAGSGIADNNLSAQKLSEAEQGFANSKTVYSAHDILSENDTQTAANPNNDQQSLEMDSEQDVGDDSDKDAANDYDSNKENDSENAAPTPPEEEDNPVLDEEGNVTNPGQMNPGTQQNQPMQMDNLPNTPIMPQQNTNMSNGDKPY